MAAAHFLRILLKRFRRLMLNSACCICLQASLGTCDPTKRPASSLYQGSCVAINIEVCSHLTQGKFSVESPIDCLVAVLHRKPAKTPIRRPFAKPQAVGADVRRLPSDYVKWSLLTSAPTLSPKRALLGRSHATATATEALTRHVARRSTLRPRTGAHRFAWRRAALRSSI